MKVDVGIIGGTGTGSRLLEMRGRTVHVPTEDGVIRGRLLEHEGARVFVTGRHAAGHKVPPHRVPYVGLARAMRKLGVRACLATAAVGSLRADWAPGTFVLASDLWDATARNTTLFDRTVQHTDMLHPFDPAVSGAVQEALLAQEVRPEQGVYVCANGPRYETPHEIRVYRQLGGEVVGMTAANEAIAMREAGVPYACLCVVTNLAAGMTGAELGHGEVTDMMEVKGGIAVRALLQAAVALRG